MCVFSARLCFAIYEARFKVRNIYVYTHHGNGIERDQVIIEFVRIVNVCWQIVWFVHLSGIETEIGIVCSCYLIIGKIHHYMFNHCTKIYCSLCSKLQCNEQLYFNKLNRMVFLLDGIQWVVFEINKSIIVN